jgi:hypothetical protein
VRFADYSHFILPLCVTHSLHLQADQLVFSVPQAPAVRKSKRARSTATPSWLADRAGSDYSDEGEPPSRPAATTSTRGKKRGRPAAAGRPSNSSKGASSACLSENDSYTFPVVRHLAPCQGVYLPKINAMRYGWSAAGGGVCDLAVRGRQGEADLKAADRNARTLQFCQVKVLP